VFELLLWRHAKAEAADGRLADFERGLAARGRSDAARMAPWIAQRAALELVLCSSARRTRETLAALSDRLPRGCELRFERGLYLAPAEQIADLLRALPDARRCVLVIGHNPGLHELALALVGEAAGRAEGGIAEGFPTAALVRLRMRAERWSDFDLEPGELADFVRPRDLSP